MTKDHKDLLVLRERKAFRVHRAFRVRRVIRDFKAYKDRKASRETKDQLVSTLVLYTILTSRKPHL